MSDETFVSLNLHHNAHRVFDPALYPGEPIWHPEPWTPEGGWWEYPATGKEGLPPFPSQATFGPSPGRLRFLKNESELPEEIPGWFRKVEIPAEDVFSRLRRMWTLPAWQLRFEAEMETTEQGWLGEYKATSQCEATGTFLTSYLDYQTSSWREGEDINIMIMEYGTMASCPKLPPARAGGKVRAMSWSRYGNHLEGEPEPETEHDFYKGITRPIFPEISWTFSTLKDGFTYNQSSDDAGEGEGDGGNPEDHLPCTMDVDITCTETVDGGPPPIPTEGLTVILVFQIHAIYVVGDQAHVYLYLDATSENTTVPENNDPEGTATLELFGNEVEVTELPISDKMVVTIKYDIEEGSA